MFSNGEFFSVHQYLFVSFFIPLWVINWSMTRQLYLTERKNLMHPNFPLTQCSFDSVITWVGSRLANFFVREFRQRRHYSLNRKKWKCVGSILNSFAGREFCTVFWAGIKHFSVSRSWSLVCQAVSVDVHDQRHEERNLSFILNYQQRKKLKYLELFWFLALIVPFFSKIKTGPFIYKTSSWWSKRSQDGAASWIHKTY